MSSKKRPHYYYKVAADSEVGKKLQEFIDECKEAQEKARAWAESVHADAYYETCDGYAGGILFVEFKNTVSKEGWENVRVPRPEGYQSTPYFTPIKGSDLEKEMQALPVVSETKLIDIFSFKPVTAKDKEGNEVPVPFSFGDTTPPLFLHHGFWYTDLPYESTSPDCILTGEKEFFRRRMAFINEQDYS